MLRESVDSSSIAFIGYDAASRVVEVEFKDSGEIYRYFDVPPEEYKAFRHAPSKGTYLNQTLKKKGYRYERVPQQESG